MFENQEVLTQKFRFPAPFEEIDNLRVARGLVQKADAGQDLGRKLRGEAQAACISNQLPVALAGEY